MGHCFKSKDETQKMYLNFFQCNCPQIDVTNIICIHRWATMLGKLRGYTLRDEQPFATEAHYIVLIPLS